MTDEIDLQHLVNDFLQRKYNRNIEVRNVKQMFESNEELDFEDLIKGLVLVIEDQKNKIKDLQDRVTMLENPD